jgi:mannose-6-phosphate isomerase
MTLYPLLLNPPLHVKVWGGRRLESIMGKTLPTTEPYGESWEMHDTATVMNGPLAGRALSEVLAQYGHELVGPDHDPALGLPLLAKILDADDWLSVQLHPNDEQARELEGQPRGKTEAWYVLSGEPGAKIVIGIQPGTTPEQMAAAIEANTLEDLLVYAEVAPGDVLFVQAGTIHALGSGLLIYEIQQSSDTTYRLYDWGRVGLDGKPREMHIEKGKRVANLNTLPEIIHTAQNPAQFVNVVESPFFVTKLVQLNDAVGTHVDLDTGGTRFHILTCIDGMVSATAGDTRLELAKGRTALIPASVGAYTLDGPARVLCSYQG